MFKFKIRFEEIVELSEDDVKDILGLEDTDALPISFSKEQLEEILDNQLEALDGAPGKIEIVT
jgi:hypothetical protein